MAESSLSIGYSDLMSEVALFLGYSGTSTDWSTSEDSQIDGIVQSGLRQFYYPPVSAGVDPSFEWSFLNPVYELSLVADTYEYDLPDDFSRIKGRIFYSTSEASPSIPVMPYGVVMGYRTNSGAQTGKPSVAAVTWKESDGTTGQRLSIMFHPVPDSAYDVSFQYEALAGKLTDAAPYPLGGMKHSETIISSCLSIAERRLNNEVGPQWDIFTKNLATSVARDRNTVAQNLGMMSIGELDYDIGNASRHCNSSNYEITYKGVTW
jgi:hypothetical protein